MLLIFVISVYYYVHKKNGKLLGLGFQLPQAHMHHGLKINFLDFEAIKPVCHHILSFDYKSAVL